ncbi:hypothetical protein [Pseudooceanicola sp. MF1-13]|uniref:hypothetical protein n=1 Tax=Pseudooceanicola sp. MF1-13 TaxID=3379095 RepID=UPI003891E680
MKRLPHTIAAVLALSLAPAAAQAACTVEYKAKQDNPLRLTVGTLQVSSCDPTKAAAEVRAHLAQQGWTLLKVLSVKE